MVFWGVSSFEGLRVLVDTDFLHSVMNTVTGALPEDYAGFAIYPDDRGLATPTPTN